MKNHLLTAWIYIRRSPYQALAAVLVMFLTFWVISTFVLLASGSQIILRYFETRPQISAFLKDETSLEQVEGLRTQLEETGKVQEVKYIDKKEALKIYKSLFAQEPLLLELVTADILPASLEVSTKEIDYLDEVVVILQGSSSVEDVVFQEDVADSLQQWTITLRKVGLGLIAVFSLVSVLVVLIIIGIKAVNHKKEIETQRLLGASGWYVRMPFLLEGMFYGGLGAFLGWSVSYLILLYSSPFLVEFLKEIPILPVSVWFMLSLLGAELLIGLIVGFLASFVATKRYLSQP